MKSHCEDWLALLILISDFFSDVAEKFGCHPQIGGHLVLRQSLFDVAVAFEKGLVPVLGRHTQVVDVRFLLLADIDTSAVSRCPKQRLAA